MRKILVVLGCVVLLSEACSEGKTKEAATTEVTAQAAEITKSSEEIRNAQQAIQAKVDALGDKVNEVPDTSRLGITLNGRYKLDKILERGEQIKKDLQQLSADYAAGKIDAKAYEEQYKALQVQAEKYAETAKTLTENLSKSLQ